MIGDVNIQPLAVENLLEDSHENISRMIGDMTRVGAYPWVLTMLVALAGKWSYSVIFDEDDADRFRVEAYPLGMSTEETRELRCTFRGAVDRQIPALRFLTKGMGARGGTESYPYYPGVPPVEFIHEVNEAAKRREHAAPFLPIDELQQILQARVSATVLADRLGQLALARALQDSSEES